MYSLFTKCAVHKSGCLMCRHLSTAEVSTALRPFYFSVHPDLFGKYPEQRNVNENSLKQLSALLEAQQASRGMSLPPLPFYLRGKDLPEGHFRLVKIQLAGNNVRDTVVKVLRACEISTEYIDKIPRSSEKTEYRKPDFADAFRKQADDFAQAAWMRSQMEEVKSVENLIEWVHLNSALGKQKHEMTSATRGYVDALKKSLCDTYGIVDVTWESGWNISHIRGVLQSIVALASEHKHHMHNLRGRVLALGQFTGVSLDGHVYLSIVEVRSNWIELIKNVSKQDSALLKIPSYEKTLSSVLRDIHIRRRKFMPKVSAKDYCNHLCRLTTSIGDFYGSGRSFPKSVPESLDRYEIVIEPEAGPLMLSPTGQFITPSTCPAAELVSFITNHLDEAVVLLTEYNMQRRWLEQSTIIHSAAPGERAFPKGASGGKQIGERAFPRGRNRNKHVEKALYKEVKERFKLKELQKDDSVTPALMILCCQRLLTRIGSLNPLHGSILHITNYYSVLSDGVLCIPWNFK